MFFEVASSPTVTVKVKPSVVVKEILFLRKLSAAASEICFEESGHFSLFPSGLGFNWKMKHDQLISDNENEQFCVI